MSKNAEKDYTIGYGRPPKTTQFKKGQSGNPRGRSKRASASIESVLAKELERHLAFNENGNHGKESKLGLMVKQAVNKALAGDFRPLTQLVKLRGPLQEARTRAAERKVDVSDRTPADTIATYLRLIREPP